MKKPFYEGTPTYHQLTNKKLTQVKDAIDEFAELRYLPNTEDHIFVALFDGTRNSIYEPDSDKTTIGRIAEAMNANVNPAYRYLGGVDALKDGNATAKTGSAASGNGSADRAEEMYRSLVGYARTLPPGESLKVVSAGFSRGAASARHFMNIVDERGVADGRGGWLHEPGTVRQSALLLDTVATGQENVLNLGIPASVDRVVHLAAIDEKRPEFSATSIRSGREADEDIRLSEIWLPGVHADIGGGWKTFSAWVSTEMAAVVMAQYGIHRLDAIETTYPENHHVTDYDWKTTDIETIPDKLLNRGRHVAYMDGIKAGHDGNFIEEPKWKNSSLSAKRQDELDFLYAGAARIPGLVHEGIEKGITELLADSAPTVLLDKEVGSEPAQPLTSPQTLAHGQSSGPVDGALGNPPGNESVVVGKTELIPREKPENFAGEDETNQVIRVSGLSPSRSLGPSGEPPNADHLPLEGNEGAPVEITEVIAGDKPDEASRGEAQDGVALASYSKPVQVQNRSSDAEVFDVEDSMMEL